MLEGFSMVESRCGVLVPVKKGRKSLDRCQSAAISGVAVGYIQAEIARMAFTRMAYILWLVGTHRPVFLISNTGLVYGLVIRPCICRITLYA